MSCSKPRVIAAEIKKDFNKSKDALYDNHHGSKPHIAGELELVGGVSGEPHWVEVRDGQLVVYPGTSPNSAPVWRLPLRRLNLQPAASGRPRGFSLTRHGERTPTATFQVASELEYSQWVRTLAAELLKQTPLEAVKYLDILGITATIPEPDSLSSSFSEGRRSLSPECLSEPDGRLVYTPLCRSSYTVPRNWLHKPTQPVEVQQPLSLIITEEPLARPWRRALSYSVDSSPEETPRCRVIDTFCHLAKQSKNCFRPTNTEHIDKCTPVEKFPPAFEDCASSKTRVKSLLKAFQTQKMNKEPPSPNPLHPLEMKDDGRTGKPPLPDVIRDLPPCERRSRTRTRATTPLRLRGKSLDVLPSTEDSQVAELIARCQQADRYVPVRDKKLLFETLGRTTSQPRFVLSSDNLSELALVDRDLAPPQPPRTQSLHDLSSSTISSSANVAVKEICRYFEQRGGSRGELATRSPSPSPECRLRLLVSQGDKGSPVDDADPLTCQDDALARRLAARAERRLLRLRQNTTECEQTVWRLQDQRDKLLRGNSSRMTLVVEARLEEERERLKRLHAEQCKVQRQLQIGQSPGLDHFNIAAAEMRHISNVR